MLFKPIPKNLLIHQVIYHSPGNIGNGSMTGKTKGNEKIINHVRFTPKRKRIIKSDNTEVLTTGILYIDAVNSEPFISPSEDGFITFQERKLKIIECSEIFTDLSTPHHIEVMLQ